MPKTPKDIYNTYMKAVNELAERPSGVSKAQLIAQLNVTKAIAKGLIEACKLTLSHKQGRTHFYRKQTDADTNTIPIEITKPEVINAKPDVVIAATIPKTTNTKTEDEDETIDNIISELDAQIIDTRQALRGAAAKAGKALGEWATHQALVDCLRERMQDLATKRMNASS